MKSSLLFALALLFVVNTIVSQDYQWLILNQLGKNGYSGSLNTYGVSPLGPQFNLRDVSTPNIGADSRAKNDLFIIYSDGQHFNSRVTPSSGLFYNGSDPASTTILHNFNSGTRSPSFMYLTNRYEGDDLPTKVRVSSGVLTGTVTSNVVGTSAPPLLSANHNVVFNREITIIVDYESAIANNKIEPGDSQPIILKFDGIRRRSDSQNFTGLNILDLKPVFGNTTDLGKAVYPNQTGVSQIEQIALDPGQGRYRYVNLKPNANALSYGPDSNGDPTYDAIFTLEYNGGSLGTHAEALAFSYDPNYLAVKSITKRSDGSHVIKYHLEFENTSDTPEDSLSAQVDFPSMFDMNSIEDLRWSVGGFPCDGKISLSPSAGNKMIFIFKNHRQLIKCNRLFPNQGKGFVEFEVKVNPGINVEDLSVSLELDKPTVFFRTQPFLIEEFRDLTECNVNGESRPIHGVTATPDQSNAPALSADSLRCSRPISIQTKCVWWGMACWIWIVLGIVLIAFLIWLITRRRNP